VKADDPFAEIDRPQEKKEDVKQSEPAAKEADLFGDFDSAPA